MADSKKITNSKWFPNLKTRIDDNISTKVAASEKIGIGGVEAWSNLGHDWYPKRQPPPSSAKPKEESTKTQKEEPPKKQEEGSKTDLLKDLLPLLILGGGGGLGAWGLSDLFSEKKSKTSGIIKTLLGLLLAGAALYPMLTGKSFTDLLPGGQGESPKQTKSTNK
jgi:hypothetical protein